MKKFYLTGKNGLAHARKIARGGTCHAAIAVAFGIFASQPAFAQNQPSADASQDGLEDIVVTARKVSEDVQKTPIAISVVTAAALKDSSIQSFANLAAQAPNLAISHGSTGDPNSPLISLRGQSQTTLALSVDAPIGLYNDGVYSTGSYGSSINHFLDIERVEVLKGPQGTLYGRNTTAGAINIYTKQPILNEVQVEATIGVGSYSRMDASLVLNLPLGDNVALRVAGGNYTREGYGTDLSFNSDVGDENSQVLRAGLLVEASPDLEIILRGNYLRTRDGGFIDKPFYMLPGGAANIAGAIDLFGGPPTPQTIADAFDFWQDRATNTPFYDVYNAFEQSGYLRNIGGSATISYQIGNATLKSITAYSDIRSDRFQDGGGAGLRILGARQTTDFRQWSEELQLTGTGLEDKLKYALGFFYYDLKGVDSVVSTVLPAFGSPNNPSTTIADIRIKAPAVYGQVSYGFLPNVNVTAGLRYGDEKKTISPYSSNPTGCQIPVSLRTNGTCYGSVSTKDNNLSFTFGLDWNPTEDMMLYAKVSRAYKSGGINQRISLDPRTAQSYTPERATDYEVGIKAQALDNRLRFNADAFYTDYADIQRTVLVGVPPVTVTANAAKAVIKGFEADLTAIPLRNFKIRASVGHVSPEYKDYQDNGTDQSGQRFNIVSNWTYTLSTSYDIPLDFGGLKLQADWNYRSNYDLQPGETPGAVSNTGLPGPGIPDSIRIQKGFGLIDLSARLAIDTIDLDIRGYVKNVAGKKYLSQAAGFVNAGLGIAYAVPGEPRSFGVEIVKRF